MIPLLPLISVVVFGFLMVFNTWGMIFADQTEHSDFSKLTAKTVKRVKQARAASKNLSTNGAEVDNRSGGVAVGAAAEAEGSSEDAKKTRKSKKSTTSGEESISNKDKTA
jgi:hypothetical protein